MHGVDLSHHQDPTKVPWDTIAASSSFAIIRFTYGRMRDRQAAEHIRRARAVGLDVGCYHFFRPSQPVADQVDAFIAAAQAADYRPGDIVPALDVEADPIPTMQHVSPTWEPKVREMAEALTSAFGAPCLIYITQREFGMLGKPDWIYEHPLWCAHYKDTTNPATPGNRGCLMHQHRVGPYDPKGPGGYFEAPKGVMQIDQNRAFGELPRSSRVPWSIVSPDPRALPTVPDADDEDDAELARLRALVATQQVDVVSPLVADAMREMAGLDSQRPTEIDPSDGGGES